ncbi:MAG: DUF3325 family protein [Acetobacter sp.]|uniref:DUF3325 family protein n=1 Tax=Acetobacter sp. TaxID=440 RepID=UPI0039EA32CF
MSVSFLFYPVMALLLVLAFALMAMTQFPHRRAVGLTDLASRQAIWTRTVAGLLVILALVLAIRNEGGAFGFLLWAGLLSLASCIVVLILSWRPTFFASLARLISSDRFRIYLNKSS